ncbi:hypothetical protein SAY87_022074 [Trapa incisa]|uniref:Senescence regulator n=1 Tax=Trapa incisa TaxID=236973 RepID=A0AAN7JSH9_9MYRT|nr:hypothetical protein SAY87_022074 [Trapa incisa]
MAKSRRLTTSRSEVLLGGYGYSHGYGGGSPETSPELREEDIWAVVINDGVDEQREEDNTTDDSVRYDWTPRAAQGDGRQLRDVRRGGEFQRVGGLSLAFQGSASTATSSPRIVHQYRGSLTTPLAAQPRGGGGSGHLHMATSAPVNVPDWSKIYRVESVESMHDLDDGEDPQPEMVPPHEFLLARSQRMAAASVFEGAGRTLKGRDMSRVRDAVWSQTGFDG